MDPGEIWTSLSRGLNLVKATSGMEINEGKSSILMSKIDIQDVSSDEQVFFFDSGK